MPVSVPTVEWLAEAHIQIGAYDAPSPIPLTPFLAGFVEGVAAHAAVREAELLELDELSAAQWVNPTRHVSFRFLAGSYADAERLASEQLLRAGLRSGMEALDPSRREFGWMASVDVQPA